MHNFSQFSMQTPASPVYIHQEFSIKNEFSILTAMLYVVAKDWKPPKCSSAGD